MHTNVAENLAVVIGAMKAGTSSIYTYLKHHPNVSLTRHKECNFFKDNQLFARGYPWFEGLFEEPAQRYIDVSPNYSKRHIFPGAAEKIAQYAPQAKIIYILRNPVDRMISHYIHNVSAGRINCSFRRLLRNEKKRRNYLLCSSYAWQFEDYEACFSRDQLLPVLFEEFVTTPHTTMNRIYRFLGLEELPDDTTAYDNKAHQSKKKTRPSVIDTCVRQPSLNSRLHKIAPGRFSKRRGIKKPELNNKERAKLMEHFKEEVSYLEHEYGLDCSIWKQQ